MRGLVFEGCTGPATTRAQHCTTVPPKWMQYATLLATLKAEEENREEFSELPFHYLEISSLLIER